MMCNNYYSYYRKALLWCLSFILTITGSDCFAQLKVGAAELPVNPGAGTYIAGHSRNRKFSGVHDSLYVKAVVVAGKGKPIAIITVDCIGLMYPQLQEIRKAVGKRISEKEFDPLQIILSSTHTHAGPDVVGLWGPDMLHSGVDSLYMQGLVRMAADVVVNAWDKRTLADMDFSVTQYGDSWVYNISEPGEVDRSVTTLRFRDKTGKSVATLTNFSCHPTFVDAVHNQVSADYVGGFYRKMNVSAGGVNLFLQGAIGGWVQPEHEPKTFEQAMFRGNELATVVLNALKTAKPVKGDQLLFKNKIFEMPVENEGFKQLAAAGVINRAMKEGVTTEIALFGIGNAWFATHPGESVPAMGLATKKLIPGDGPEFVLGLGMDAMGYILKPDFFDASKKIPHSAYLCSMSVGKEAASIVMRVLEELVGEIGRDKQGG